MTSSTVIYLQAALGATSLMIAVIFYLAWKTLGEKPWALNWSIAYLASTFYWLAHLSAPVFPVFESYWLTANAFGFVLLTLALRGHCQRTNCAYLPKNLWPIALVLYAGVFVTTVIYPHAGVSAAILPFTAALTLLLSAVMIIRHREETRPAEWAAAISIILYAVGQLPAAAYVLGLGPEWNTVMQLMYAHPSVILMPAGFIGIAMFVLFMLASDLSEDMKEIAVRDGLTGLLNRRGFGEQAAIAYATARRTRQPVAVIMTDIDHFKSVNDEFGHAVGDEALTHFSKLLCEDRRVEDIVARVGGEEFVLVLPGTDIRRASAIADEMCARMEASRLKIDGRDVGMTASFGVAAIAKDDTCLTDIIVKADRALYRSKRAGRNRVDLESSQTLRTLKPVRGAGDAGAR